MIPLAEAARVLRQRALLVVGEAAGKEHSCIARKAACCAALARKSSRYFGCKIILSTAGKCRREPRSQRPVARLRAKDALVRFPLETNRNEYLLERERVNLYDETV